MHLKANHQTKVPKNICLSLKKIFTKTIQASIINLECNGILPRTASFAVNLTILQLTARKMQPTRNNYPPIQEAEEEINL